MLNRALSETPERIDNKIKRNPSDQLSSFQKHEALVVTDHSNKYSEWPIRDNSSNYQHKPLINKVVVRQPLRIPKAKRTNKDPKEVIEQSSKDLHSSLGFLKAKVNKSTKKKAGKSKETKSSSELKIVGKNAISQRTPVGHFPGTNPDNLLSKAEDLLKHVTICIGKTMGSINPGGISLAGDYTDKNKFLSEDKGEGSEEKKESAAPVLSGRAGTMIHNLPSDTTQIDWLIRGLPEAYDDSPEVDDEMVREVLREGGDPPRQLQLPSLHYSNQQTMEKLLSARSFKVCINQLNLYSARYGFRKEGSYLLIHPPTGCSRKGEKGSLGVVIPLPELQDAQHQVAKLLDQGRNKRDSLKNYFTGGIDLLKIVEFEVKVDDSVVKCWLEEKEKGFLVVELFSYITPIDTVVRGRISEPVRFGIAKIPLSGLLGTSSLDAVVRIDIEADISTHSVVLNRMQSLLGHTSHSFQHGAKLKPVGNKMGTVTARLTLSTDPKENKEQLKRDASSWIQNEEEFHVQPLMVPVKSKKIKDTVSRKDKIEEALGFLPSETPIFQSKKSFSFLEPTGVLVCCIKNLIIPSNLIMKIESKPDFIKNLSVVIAFKLSPSTKDEFSANIPLSIVKIIKESESIKETQIIDFSSSRLIKTEKNDKRKKPILEIWLEWENHTTNVAKERFLLGLSKFPPDYRSENLIELPVLDVSGGSSHHHQGTVLASLHQLQVEVEFEEEGVEAVSRSMQSNLNTYFLHYQEQRADFQQQLNKSETAKAHVQSDSTEEEKSRLRGDPRGKQEIRIPRISAENPKTHNDDDDDASVLSEDSLVDRFNRKDEVEQENLPTETILEMEETKKSTPEMSPVSSPDQAKYESIDDLCAFLNDPGEAELMKELKNKVQERSFDSSVDPEPRPHLNLGPKNEKITESTGFMSDQTPTTTFVHILDISVEGVFDLFVPHEAAGKSSHSIFGCFLTYTTPGLDLPAAQDLVHRLNSVIPSRTQSIPAVAGPELAATTHVLWWDGDCAILNGSNRHRFEAIDHPSHVLESLLVRAEGDKRDIEFSLGFSDLEGNLPSEPRQFGKALLTQNQLLQFFERGQSPVSIQIPVEISELPTDLPFTRNIAKPSRLKLSLSHRLEPILLTASGNKPLPTTLSPEPKPMDKPRKGLLQFDLSGEDLFGELDYGPALSSREVMGTVGTAGQGVRVNVSLHELAHLNGTVVGSGRTGGRLFCVVGVKRFTKDEVVQGLTVVDLSPDQQVLSSFVSCSSTARWDQNFSFLLTPASDPLYPNAGVVDLTEGKGDGQLRGSYLVLSLYLRTPLLPHDDLYAGLRHPQRVEMWEETPRLVRPSDLIVGSTAVDLSTLALGMPVLDGWYDLVDALHKPLAQLRLSVRAALESQLRRSTDVGTSLPLTVVGEPSQEASIINSPFIVDNNSSFEQGNRESQALEPLAEPEESKQNYENPNYNEVKPSEEKPLDWLEPTPLPTEYNTAPRVEILEDSLLGIRELEYEMLNKNLADLTDLNKRLLADGLLSSYAVSVEVSVEDAMVDLVLKPSSTENKHFVFDALSIDPPNVSQEYKPVDEESQEVETAQKLPAPNDHENISHMIDLMFEPSNPNHDIASTLTPATALNRADYLRMLDPTAGLPPNREVGSTPVPPPVLDQNMETVEPDSEDQVEEKLISSTKEPIEEVKDEFNTSSTVLSEVEEASCDNNHGTTVTERQEESEDSDHEPYPTKEAPMDKIDVVPTEVLLPRLSPVLLTISEKATKVVMEVRNSADKNISDDDISSEAHNEEDHWRETRWQASILSIDSLDRREMDSPSLDSGGKEDRDMSLSSEVVERYKEVVEEIKDNFEVRKDKHEDVQDKSNGADNRKVDCEIEKKLPQNNIHYQQEQEHNQQNDDVSDEDDESKNDDSSMTSKIRKLVDQELERVLGLDSKKKEIISKFYNPPTSVAETKLEEMNSIDDVNLKTSEDSPSTGVILSGKLNETNFSFNPKTKSISLQTSMKFTKTKLNDGKNDFSSETTKLVDKVFDLSASQVKALMPVVGLRGSNMFDKYRSKGKQRSFVDAETERISKIMMGGF